VTRPSQLGRSRTVLDGRSRLELGACFLLCSALFSLLGIDFAHTLTDDPGYSTHTVQLGALVGIGVGLVLTALTYWAWRRGPGRAAQRLGRRAWRNERLPPDEPERTLALDDLGRRSRVAGVGLPPLVMTGLWVLIGALQIAGSHPWFHSVTWGVYTAVFVGIGIRGALDRRRLPQLHALLESTS
jgi:hypothetical protein